MMALIAEVLSIATAEPLFGMVAGVQLVAKFHSVVPVPVQVNVVPDIVVSFSATPERQGRFGPALAST